ncbi:MAG: type II secretion system protein GspM [Gammaproteobacteria bacterium]|nr:type II secretion system protein GspM [Gammaproteobacteria bacterium]
MIERLTPLQRRAAALSLLVACVALVAAVVVAPIWRAYSDNRAAIAQMRGDIARFSRLAANMSELDQILTRLRERDPVSPYVLGQGSVPLAAAALQERVKAVVTASGGALTSTQVLPVDDAGPFRRITVNVRMAVSTAALQQVLHELEAGLPYLVVDELIILARQARNRRLQVPTQDLLDVRFNLSGFMRPEARET